MSARCLSRFFKEFGDRHQRVSDILAQRFSQVRQYLPADVEVSEARQLLIGSYFTSEYSLESAALFNPSIIPHPDQANVAEGSVRVILSLRATGEGHISSITFRSGVLDENGEIELEPASRFVTEPRPIPSAQCMNAICSCENSPSLAWTQNLPDKSLDALGETVHPR